VARRTSKEISKSDVRNMAEKTDAKKLKKEEKQQEKKPRRLLGIRRKKTAEKEVPVVRPAKREKNIDPLDVLKFVLMTERSIRMIETENKMVFVVDRNAKKNDIISAFEKSFDSKVEDVNVMNDQKGRKRAFIKLKTPGAAGEIAIRLGII
jgi:ribosomal protein L23